MAEAYSLGAWAAGQAFSWLTGWNPFSFIFGSRSNTRFQGSLHHPELAALYEWSPDAPGWFRHFDLVRHRAQNQYGSVWRDRITGAEFFIGNRGNLNLINRGSIPAGVSTRAISNYLGIKFVDEYTRLGRQASRPRWRFYRETTPYQPVTSQEVAGSRYPDVRNVPFTPAYIEARSQLPRFPAHRPWQPRSYSAECPPGTRVQWDYSSVPPQYSCEPVPVQAQTCPPGTIRVISGGQVYCRQRLATCYNTAPATNTCRPGYESKGLVWSNGRQWRRCCIAPAQQSQVPVCPDGYTYNPATMLCDPDIPTRTVIKTQPKQTFTSTSTETTTPNTQQSGCKGDSVVRNKKAQPGPPDGTCLGGREWVIKAESDEWATWQCCHVQPSCPTGYSLNAQGQCERQVQQQTQGCPDGWTLRNDQCEQEVQEPIPTQTPGQQTITERKQEQPRRELCPPVPVTNCPPPVRRPCPPPMRGGPCPPQPAMPCPPRMLAA